MDIFMGAAPTPRPSKMPTGSWARSQTRFSRRSSWRNSRSTTRTVSFQESPLFIGGNEIPIWLSVFFGNLDATAPKLDHARFGAHLSDQVFECRNIRGSRDSFSKSLRSSALRSPPGQQRLSQDLAAVESIIQLASAFTDEILSCVTEGCAVCHVEKALSLVHRPLTATRNGYFDLPDFSQTGRLMSIIASHTAHITGTAEIDWSIGNIPNENPYVCVLAVPVCSADSECGRVAAQRIQSYLDGIFEGTTKPNPAAAKFVVSERTSQIRTPGQSFSSSRDDAKTQSDGPVDLSFAESSFMSSDSDNVRLYTVGATIFVGKPSLQIDDPPKRGQLSCLVYSSGWPKPLLPGPSKNEADDAIDYCRIAASHERLILENADFRCAVCSELIAAGSLLHRPLAFIRTNSKDIPDESVRQLVMKLFQYVKGRWNFSAVNAALGSESDAHIFDYVVPICIGKSICEEVARAAANEFIKLLLPSGMRLIFPGLDPDTDLKVFEDVFEDEFEWEHGVPRLVVCKPSTEGLMVNGSDHGEDSSDCSLTASELQQWYELRFSEEMAKRENKRSSRDISSAEHCDSDSDTASEIDESMVWIYVRSDLEDGTSQNGNQAARQPCSESGLVKKLERQMLFQPMMSFNFWLVNEALRQAESRSTVDDDEYDVGEASSQYSGDTEIWQPNASH